MCLKTCGVTADPPELLNFARAPAQAARILARWKLLLPVGPAYRYARNSVIFSQGDSAQSVFLLSRGITKLVSASPDGEISILGLRYPGDLIGDWWEMKSNLPISAIAIVPCEIHRVDIRQVRAGAERNSDVAEFHREALRRDLCNLAARHLELLRVSAAERLEGLLWDLAAVLGGSESAGALRLILPLSNQEMADLCGLSASHYKQVRHDLEATGRLRHCGRRIWVLAERSGRLGKSRAAHTA
jgi:CRP-like cAMP-binding protein